MCKRYSNCFISIGILLLISACNPYFKSHIYLNDVVFSEYNNSGATIKSVTKGTLNGNSISIILPDSINMKNFTGQFSYEIELSNELKVNESLLRMANYKDSVNQIVITYLFYDPGKRFLSKPKDRTELIDRYFQSQIKSFQFDSLNLNSEQKRLDGKRIVYCNFYF